MKVNQNAVHKLMQMQDFANEPFIGKVHSEGVGCTLQCRPVQSQC